LSKSAKTNGTGSVAPVASVLMDTALPGVPTFTRCTSVPLIQTTYRVDHRADRNALNSLILVSTKLRRRKMQVYTFCMFGEPGAAGQGGRIARGIVPERRRRIGKRRVVEIDPAPTAVVSGVEASVCPLKRRQFAFVLKSSAASAASPTM